MIAPSGINLAKDQIYTLYTFWTKPILIFSPVQIIMRHPIAFNRLDPCKNVEIGMELGQVALCFESSTRMTGFDLKKQFLSRSPQYSKLLCARLPLKLGRAGFFPERLAFRSLIFFCKVKIYPIINVQSGLSMMSPTEATHIFDIDTNIVESHRNHQ